MTSINSTSHTYAAMQFTNSNARKESIGGVPTNNLPDVKTGIAISDGMAIDLSQYELQAALNFLKDKLSELPPPMSVEEYSSRLAHQGEVRQTAVIKEGGAIVGTVSEKGMTFLNNSIGNAVVGAGNDLNAIQSALRERFGGSVVVEKFSSGAEPTYAEVHESVYGGSYSSLVAKQTEEYRLYQGSSLIGRRVDISV